MILDLGKDIITPVDGVVTQERLLSALQDGTFDRLSEYSCKGINHSQLSEMIEKIGENYTEIENFWGGAESNIEILNLEVPDGFPNRMKMATKLVDYEVKSFVWNEETQTEEYVNSVSQRLEIQYDENENPIMVPKLWSEYCLNYRKSVDNTKIIFRVGYTDLHGNLLHKISDSELRLWIDYFGITNITVWKDYKLKLRSDKYTQVESNLE